MLCQVCKDIFCDLRLPDVGTAEAIDGGHQPSIQSLYNSAIQECEICMISWATYNESQRKVLLARDTPPGQFVTVYSINVERHHHFDSSTVRPPLLEICSHADMEIFEAGLIGEAVLGSFFLLRIDRAEPPKVSNAKSLFVPKSVNELAWSISKSWLDSCIQNHPECGVPEDDIQFRPTRLIYLGGGDSTVKLLLTDEATVSEPYITLSHCWGKKKIIQLTKGSIPAFREGIAVTMLPKSFQDALVVSKHLGILYIWIDSLCIIQDDEEDWQKEAALMHKIYSSAFCNVAATGAEDGTQGLFLDRKARELCPTTIQFATETGTTVVYELVAEGFWRFHVSSDTHGPLNRRGWVFQERILSRRILHFGRQQVLWECAGLCAAEQYPRGIPDDTEMLVSPSLRVLRNPRASLNVTSEGLSSDWWALITEYSKCSLTKEDDRLVALSGLAQRMKSLNNDYYVAGLWGQNLLRQLLWRSYSKEGEDMDIKRPSQYIAPSFSWASLDAIITCNVDFPSDAKDLARVLGWNIVPKYAKQDTGQLRIGYMHLQGLLRPVYLEPSTTTTTFAWFTSPRATAGRRHLAGSSNPPAVRTKGLAHLDGTQFSSMAYVIPIVFLRRAIECLLLRHIHYDHGPDVFERLGTAFFDEERFESLVEHFEAQESLPCDRYDAQSMQHTICLI